jgi:hypothetical protein
VNYASASCGEENRAAEIRTDAPTILTNRTRAAQSVANPRSDATRPRTLFLQPVASMIPFLPKKNKVSSTSHPSAKPGDAMSVTDFLSLTKTYIASLDLSHKHQMGKPQKKLQLGHAAWP